MFKTGDPLIDKWEDEIARGLEPDLTEGMSPEARKRERQALERLKKRSQDITVSKAAEEFADNYAEMAGLETLGSGVPKTG